MNYRIAVTKKENGGKVFKIFNLEINETDPDINMLAKELFHNPVTEEVVEKMPAGEFLEIMYHNGVVDPENESIIIACAKLGVKVEAAKVGRRYYDEAREGVIISKEVHMTFTSEPQIETLKPRGQRNPMEYFDLTAMSDDELLALSTNGDLSLSLRQMSELVEIQKDEGMSAVNDVFLEVFAARWCDHCNHTKWKSLGLFKVLMDATAKINNPNLVSAFVDNSGAWDFYDDLVLLLTGETHNSPTQSEAYGGQLTKLGGILRDIFEHGLGGKPIGNVEMTIIGALEGAIYELLNDQTLSPQTIAKETIRAIADYGNRMGVPMLLSKMISHPNFGGKTFALGVTAGIATKEAAIKGVPWVGDLAVLVGAPTGNDGYHGATVSSGERTENTDQGDSTHVQIGNAFPEQKMMRAGIELRDKGCLRARNDFGAAGFTTFMEMAEPNSNERGSYPGGILLNFAPVPLKCVGLDYKIMAVGESQERFAHCVVPEKLDIAMEIYNRYGLEATIMGVMTGNERVQIMSDDSVVDYTPDMQISGENILDVAYSQFSRCPLPELEIVDPPPVVDDVEFPEINRVNVTEMATAVTGHFDVSNQAYATRQYDSTVQGISYQGPLYGENYNIASLLGVCKPVFGKSYGMTLSSSFHPWQFEVDPVRAALNAMIDAIVTHVVAGVDLQDICLADNFYTPNKNPYAYHYLSRQVRSIAELSILLGTPFFTGKDSSSGSATFRKILGTDIFQDITVNALCSLHVAAMGKIPDVNRLVLHRWQKPGNLLYVLGQRSKTISGSILSSTLGITGKALEGIAANEVRPYFDELSALVSTGKLLSASPVNRGGIFMRIFEGVEASGFGVKSNLCTELFPESFGAVLVEVEPDFAPEIENRFGSSQALCVGEIVPDKGIETCGIQLPWDEMFEPWNTVFKREVTKP